MGVIDINSAIRKSESEYSHSKKLEWIIRDFISQSGYGYYDDEISYGVLKNYFKLKNDICVESEIGISFIDIRDDYSSDDEEFSWVSKNYEVLMRYWNCEINDKEVIDILKKKEY